MVASGVQAEAAVVRQPYLQVVTPSSVTVVWRTDQNSANNSRVQYGTDLGNLDQEALSSTVAPIGLTDKDHIVTITGLSPATTYFYNVGTQTDGVQAPVPSESDPEQYFFVTAPPTGPPMAFRVWVLGDSGFGSADQMNVRNAMLNETALHPPSPKLILHAGDIAYDTGTTAEFTNKHFAIYEDILRHTSLYPTLGNHEWSSLNFSLGTGPYLDSHVLPRNGEAGGMASNTELYYSFDYANAHFIVLDSMESDPSSGSDMHNWLLADLAATGQEWVIAY